MIVKGMKITAPKDIFEAVKPWRKKPQENFLTVTLNGAHEVIKVHHVTKGTVNKTIVHPRECYRPALFDNASAVAFVHNHPSGQLEPSEEDQRVTKDLGMAAQILGLNMLDHLIISKNGFYSIIGNVRHNTFSSHELEAFSKKCVYGEG